MRVLRPSGEIESFDARLSQASSSILFLDYDGTLAPLQPNRMEARPYAGVEELLSEISLVPNGRLVIVSSRPVRQFSALLLLDPLPEIWGSYGFERVLPGGSLDRTTLSEEASAGLEKEAEWIRARGFEPYLERKPFGLALHGRGFPPDEFAEVFEEARRRWTRLDLPSLCLEPFDGGLELRFAGRDKGFAVRSVLKEEESEAFAAYLGDDWSDEPAFRAVRSSGIAVLVRPTFRKTEADLWIFPPEELLGFLRRWRDAAFGGRELLREGREAR